MPKSLHIITLPFLEGLSSVFARNPRPNGLSSVLKYSPLESEITKHITFIITTITGHCSLSPPAYHQHQQDNSITTTKQHLQYLGLLNGSCNNQWSHHYPCLDCPCHFFHYVNTLARLNRT